MTEHSEFDRTTVTLFINDQQQAFLQRVLVIEGEKDPAALARRALEDFGASLLRDETTVRKDRP